MKTTKEKYRELTKEGKRNVAKDVKYGGVDVHTSVFFEHLKESILAIIAVIVGIIVIIGAVQGCFNFNAKLCRHNEIREKSIEFNESTEKFTAYCKECYRTINLNTDCKIEYIKEPTCIELGKGTYIYTCEKYPDYTYQVTKTIPTTSCNWTVIEEKIPSTCQKEGRSEKMQCIVCGAIYEGSPIGLSDHHYEDYGYVAPTCTSTGLTSIKKCKDCDATIGEHQVIDMVPHNITGSYTTEQTYENGSYIFGTCGDCEYEELQKVLLEPGCADTFDYTVDKENNEVILTNVKFRAKEVTIPGHIDGIPVKLAPNLFEGDTTLEILKFNEGVFEIGIQSFKDCTSLKEIKFPKSLLTIEKEAFLNCSGLRKLKIDYGQIKERAFAECSNLRTVDLGDTLGGLGNNSFYNCFKLIFFKFPSYYGNGRINVFDTDMRYGNTIDEISNYVILSSGRPSFDNYYNGETSDDVIKEIDGFYYYKNSANNNVLISIDREEKNIIVPTLDSHNIKISIIDGRLFRGMENEIDSIFVPISVNNIYPCNMFYKNLKIYYEGTNLLSSLGREIGGSYIDPTTSEVITYKSISYLYSETNEEGSQQYWYYDENNNIVEHQFPFINWSTKSYFALGESLTYGSNSYPSLVVEKLGLKNTINKAQSDSTLLYKDEYTYRIYDQVPDYYNINSINILSVMCGTNDFINNSPLGTINDSGDEFDTIYGSLNKTIERLLRNDEMLTDTLIFFITPLKQFKFNQVNEAGVSMEDIVTAIKEVINKYNTEYALYYSHKIKILDLYNEVDFSSTTDPHSDGLTPTQEFVENIIAPKITQFIIDNYRQEQK